jgi:hypothetical protein
MLLLLLPLLPSVASRSDRLEYWIPTMGGCYYLQHDICILSCIPVVNLSQNSLKSKIGGSGIFARQTRERGCLFTHTQCAL